MSRPLRIEFPNAIYHVTSRGDRREAIYRDDLDRQAQLDTIAHAMDRFDARVLAYCQMGNHYHLVLQTRQANLSQLMRHVNGVYTQAFNRRHGLVGHLFQGRFKAILVDRDAYMLTLCRYVERNPVAAGLVASPSDWAWSSCRAHLGLVTAPAWLDSDGLHGYLLGQTVGDSHSRARAAQLYSELVNQNRAGDADFWQSSLKGQVFLGDEAFVGRMQAMVQPQRLDDRAIPKPQRQRIPCTWPEALAACDQDRNRAIAWAYSNGGLTMTALAQNAGLSVAQVSRIVAAAERGEEK